MCHLQLKNLTEGLEIEFLYRYNYSHKELQKIGVKVK